MGRSGGQIKRVPLTAFTLPSQFTCRCVHPPWQCQSHPCHSAAGASGIAHQQLLAFQQAGALAQPLSLTGGAFNVCTAALARCHIP